MLFAGHFGYEKFKTSVVNQKSFCENAAECPALWAGMNAAISKNR
jgi:hypothetical protein